MTRYSEEELRAIITYTESSRTERKKLWNKEIGKKAREAVCAFANDLPNSGEAGVLVVGANDDGTPNLDFMVDDQVLLAMTDIRTDGQIVPPPSMYVERRRVDGHDYAIAVVEPADSPPVRFDGRIWVRSGPRREVANAQDERILNEKRRHSDGPEDLRLIASTTYLDINLLRFRLQYLPAAFAKEVLEANDRTDIQRLSALKLVSPEPPHRCTLAGCLALVDNASWHLEGAYIQFLVIKGTSLADPKIDELKAVGHIEEQIASIEAKLEAYNRRAVDYSQPKERVQYTYPPEAYEQLLRNAVMHKHYLTGFAPVRVYLYDDRLEIINSGGPYGDVTVSNFGMPGYAAYRNPNLAEVMRVLGLVQRFGSGIQIAREACRRNSSRPPEFKVEASQVQVTLYAASGAFELQ